MPHSIGNSSDLMEKVMRLDMGSKDSCIVTVKTHQVSALHYYNRISYKVGRYVSLIHPVNTNLDTFGIPFIFNKTPASSVSIYLYLLLIY